MKVMIQTLTHTVTPRALSDDMESTQSKPGDVTLAGSILVITYDPRSPPLPDLQGGVTSRIRTDTEHAIPLARDHVLTQPRGGHKPSAERTFHERL